MAKATASDVPGAEPLPHSQADVGEAVAIETRRRFSVAGTFAALKYPNYRLWFCGQLGSLVGTWMQSTAEGFLVFELTHSPAYLGYVAFAAGVPSWIFMLFGGVVADRFPRRTLIIITQSTMMVLAFTSAALTFTHLIQPWMIIVLAFILGIANAFDAPARQSFVLEMVEREDLSNAIALNSTMFQMATVVGPSIAGITYALVGPAWCFTINGISFIFVITALLLMKLKPMEIKRRTASAVGELKVGLGYVMKTPIMRTLLAVAAVSSIFGLSIVTLFPAWAVTVLGGNAATNGLMQSARGLGALSGALMIASLGRFKGKGRLLMVAMFIFPLSIVIFANLFNVIGSLLSLILMGWAFMVLFNLVNILIQQNVTDDLRGRVMGIYSLTLFGFLPLGSLGAGALAERYGEPITVMFGASVAFVFSLFVFWKIPQLRRMD